MSILVTPSRIFSHSWRVCTPYYAEQQKAQLVAASEAAVQLRKAQRSGNPAKRSQAQVAIQAQAAQDPAEILAALTEKAAESSNEFGIRMMLRMAEDIKGAPVHDLLFRLPSGLQAVLTVSSEYYSPEVNEYLRAGAFRVIGKVTKVIGEGQTINLTRRTLLGVANPSVAQGIVQSADTEDLKLDVSDPIITAPAVQILPMAIFI